MKAYTQDELSKILELHRLFLKNDPSGVRANLEDMNLEDANLEDVDLKGANLRHADLRYANLRYANLENANLNHADLNHADLRYANLENARLKGANLSNTDLDYSGWPLWCGSFGVHVDTRIAAQLAYHFCRLDCDDPEYITARNTLIDFANKFHRANELGKLENKE